MYAKLLSVAVGVLFVLGAGTARADGTVAENEVPKVAMDAVMTTVPEAKFISGQLGEENHRAIYKLNMKDKNGGVVHIRVTPDGKVTRMVSGFLWENTLTIDQVPQNVKDAVTKLRPTAKILEVAKGHHDDLVVYEIDIAEGEGETIDTVDVSEKGEVINLEKKIFQHHTPAAEQK